MLQEDIDENEEQSPRQPAGATRNLPCLTPLFAPYLRIQALASRVFQTVPACELHKDYRSSSSSIKPVASRPVSRSNTVGGSARWLRLCL